jgi:hypothetical protein
VWWERREFSVGEELQVVHRSAMPIGVLVTNYWRSKKKLVDRKEAWSCPPEVIIKINVDATYDINQGNGGMGAIAREEGTTMTNSKLVFAKKYILWIIHL